MNATWTELAARLNDACDAIAREKGARKPSRKAIKALDAQVKAIHAEMDAYRAK